MGTADKGWMGGGMKFGVGDDVTAKDRGPLLPLRLLVVADLVPRAPFNAGASAPEAALRVDPTAFDDLFAKLRPRLAIEVPSVLAEGKNVRVDLAPTSMKSFRPDGLCFEVPLLRSLLDGRIALERLRDGSMSADAAEGELERLWSGSRFAREVLGLLPGDRPAAAAPVAAAQPEGGGLDSLLGMVDLQPSYSGGDRAEPAAPAAPRKAESNKFAALISQVIESGRSGRAKNPSDAIARVEKALGAQLGAILQHPEFRRLEEAWRGLRFLVDRAAGHGSTRIDLVSARPDEAADALARTVRTGASSEPPVTCALVDLTVDGTVIAFSRLEKLAETAEAFSVPTIVHGTPGLLGTQSLAEVERLDYKGALFEAKERAPWRSSAAKPSMRWVAIAMNRVLSRPPFDKSTSRVREAVVKELPDDDGAWVWMDPGWAVASLILQSFRDTGWPCRLLGPRAGGLIENLPVREARGGEYEGQEGVAIPTEAFVSTDTQKELARLGILVLASAPNSDAAIVMHAPTAYVPPPKRTYDSATTEPEVRFDRVPLVDQLFVARLAQFLRLLCSRIPAKSDPAEVQPIIQAALWELFDAAKPGSIELQVRARVDAGETLVSVSVTPRHFLGVSLDEVSLELPLG